MQEGKKSKEFVSKVEKIMPAEELLLPPSPGFGKKYKKYLSHAIAHPAKANTNLLEFLILKHTKEGDTILDPMAGTGSTGVVAALHGRNAIQVELEEKFFRWMEIARKKVEEEGAKGKIVNIRGDARKLTELLKKADAVITSPPYSEVLTKKRKGYTKISTLARTRAMPQDTQDKNIANLPHGKIDAVLTSPPYSEGIGHDSGDQASKKYLERLKLQHKYTRQMTSQGNIARLKHGKIDAVLTSPPYGDQQALHRGGGNIGFIRPSKNGKIGTDEKDKCWFISENQENIANLPLGKIDAVLTSPPYAHESTASKPTKLEEQRKFRMGHSKEEPYTREDYRPWSKHVGGNIGKRKLFVRVPCPPEEAQFHDTRPGRKGTIWEYTKEVEATPEVIEKIQKMKSKKKGRSETYLEAMLKVYCEMYKVLKPGGLAIIIIKPFIRRKKVVDLPYHTYLLMREAGFSLVKLYKLRLQRVSFWRILYRKKHPEVPRINHEYILVMKKI